MNKPCDQCPWRLANQGKPHKYGFYTKANLRRLWNEVRGGGTAQSCHMTDPGHPDHVAVGAKPGATPRECPGSVILVLREVRKTAVDGTVSSESLKLYQLTRKKGLSKSGILYWIVSRIQMAGVPLVGGAKLPDVDENDPEIGLPEALREG